RLARAAPASRRRACEAEGRGARRRFAPRGSGEDELQGNARAGAIARRDRSAGAAATRAHRTPEQRGVSQTGQRADQGRPAARRGARATAGGEIRALGGAGGEEQPDQGLTRRLPDKRVISLIQFTSHVLPPSAEKACSKWAACGEIEVHWKRTRIARPFQSVYS